MCVWASSLLLSTQQRRGGMSKSTAPRKQDPNFRPKKKKKPPASWSQVLGALAALSVALLLAYPLRSNKAVYVEDRRVSTVVFLASVSFV